MDTVGPYPEPLGGSRYVFEFMDSASRLQQPCGTRDNSAPAILAGSKRFVEDVRAPRAFRTKYGSEDTDRIFSEYCSGFGIRRELTSSYTPQKNGPVESALASTMKAGLSARLKVNKLSPDLQLERVKDVRDCFGTSS